MGRRSLAEERRGEILAAFERCIAREGIDVPLERIADEAGVQRSLIRHYLGNRDELVDQLMARIADQYPRRIADALGPALGDGPGGVLDMLFADSPDATCWDDAILAVVNTAHDRYPQAKAHVTRMAEAIVAHLAAALAQLYPHASPEARYEAAYGVICIVQTDYTLRTIGLDPHHTDLARASAERLLAGLEGRG